MFTSVHSHWSVDIGLMSSRVELRTGVTSFQLPLVTHMFVVHHRIHNEHRDRTRAHNDIMFKSSCARILLLYYSMPHNKYKRTSVQASSAVQVDSEDSDASDEMSDPELDIEHDEEEAVLNFACARDAARERLAPRTRQQYDLFIGLMARFFMSDLDCKKFVDGMSCILPLPCWAISRYLDYVECKKIEFKPGHFKPVSASYYKTAVNCIYDKYTCEQKTIPEDVRLLLFSRQRIFRRRIADMKARGEYPQASIRCISGQGYTLLCEALAKAKPAEEGGWAWQLVSCIWCYVIFLWNLLARCDRVAQLRWENFTWTCDSLTVFIPKSKSDQGGDRAYFKKLYTSTNPACCPVLALAVQFFGRDSTRSEFVFPRADTRRAGSRQLARVLQQHFTLTDWAMFGCNPLGIAWHHFKRGGMTFLTSMMDGPSHAAVKIRGDQTVSDVTKFYITQSTGQDGYIGRLLSMLPYGEPQFCQQEYTLPPSTVIPWLTLVPDYESLPQAFKYEVLPILLATIVKHHEWLRSTLASSHPLIASELFTTHDAIIRGATSCVREQQRDMGRCTGLPLSMQTHLLLRSSRSSAPPPTLVPFQAAPQWLQDVAAPKATDLSMRTLYALPRDYALPKLSIAQCWRAWWVDTAASPMPLRFIGRKLKHASEKVRYSRYKRIVKILQSGMPAELCEANVAASFKKGWTSLEMYLRLHHSISIDADAAPSSLYDTLCRLGATFHPPAFSTLLASHTGPPRPLDEVLREHLHVLNAAEACAGASAARQTVLVSQLHSALRPPTKRGRAGATVSAPAPATAPAPDTHNLKCCCGMVCTTLGNLKRHHDGAGGKQPRERAHPCTAGCSFPSRVCRTE